ncbi:MAG TPA: hypothetical protein ENN65_04715 [Candidatus Hydrogenedentes bacterium]|nr:hypothetical protein [Candidatus Hydrogenedentota bacterium]
MHGVMREDDRLKRSGDDVLLSQRFCAGGIEIRQRRLCGGAQHAGAQARLPGDIAKCPRDLMLDVIVPIAEFSDGNVGIGEGLGPAQERFRLLARI